MSTGPQIRKLYVVKKRIDFWKEDESVRKYFVDKEESNAYLEQLSNEDAKVPTIVFIETTLCISDANQNPDKVYMLQGKPIQLEKEIFIEFSYFRPAE